MANQQTFPPNWQSAGGLYNSSLTLSYSSATLPAVWATAAAGNYDQNAINFGSTTSERSAMYGVPNSEYWSIGGGLDLTNWVWNAEQESEQSGGTQPSVKLKPVIAQDTGFGKYIPTGQGLFQFSTMDDVLAALDAINSDYRGHCRAVREIANEYFEARSIASAFLTDVGQ